MADDLIPKSAKCGGKNVGAIYTPDTSPTAGYGTKRCVCPVSTGDGPIGKIVRVPLRSSALAPAHGLDVA